MEIFERFYTGENEMSASSVYLYITVYNCNVAAKKHISIQIKKNP